MFSIPCLTTQYIVDKECTIHNPPSIHLLLYRAVQSSSVHSAGGCVWLVSSTAVLCTVHFSVLLLLVLEG